MKYRETKVKFVFFIVLLSFSTLSFAGNKVPVILDTDMAIDDWAALLLLAMHEDINLLAVTANGVGESRCQPAMENIPKLLDLTPSQKVAIACGDDYPIDGFFAFPEAWRQQADTLSNVKLPTSQREVSKLHSVELIHKILKENSSEKVILVSTGSLTNIAQWLTKYPQQKSRVSRLVIMGGAFDVPGNIIVPGFTDKHPNLHAEWNIFVDPKAASIVFKSGLPIETVGLDVTNQVKVEAWFATAFKKSVATPAAEFWDKVLDDNDWFIDSGEYYFWDVLAAIVAIDSSFCEGTYDSVEVSYDVTDEPWQASALKSIPKTLADGSVRNHFSAKTAGITRVSGSNPKVKVCRKTKAQAAFDLFTKTINSRDTSKSKHKVNM